MMMFAVFLIFFFDNVVRIESIRPLSQLGLAANEVVSPSPAPSLALPVNSVTETVGLLVASRILAESPFEASDEFGSSSGSPNVPVIVICTILLAGVLIGFFWYICAKLKQEEDDDEVVQSPRNDVQLSSGCSHVNGHGSRGSVYSVSPVENRRGGGESKPTHPPYRAVANGRGGRGSVDSVSPVENRRGGGESKPTHPPDRAVANGRRGGGESKPSRHTFLLDGRKPDRATEFRVSYPGTSKPRSLRGAEFGLILFSHDDLRHATHNFSPANILGEGGFATVHMGCLSDGTIVAVKVLKSENTKGDTEFRNEVTTISLAKHRNIVRLVGYCINFSRCIVYEYVENKTLHDHIKGGKGIKTMVWPIRMKIAIDAAKGIAYLHEDCNPRIIHRDIKPANILLDHEFVAKVADFGIAKLCPEHFKSHIASYVMGSFGFIDPAYSETRELTFKSDVYSFGVVLLQLVSAVTDLPKLYQLRMEQLPRALKSGNFRNIADPRLNNNYVHDEMALILTCAEACCRKDPKDRPPMIQVSRVLERLISVNKLKIINIRRQGV